LDSAWLARSSSFYTSINAHSKGHAVIVFTEDGEISGLADYERPRTVVQIWRIDPAALPRLHALRATALAWKKLPNDHGKRELSLWLELAGCQRADAGSRAVTTLMRFTEQSEYIPIVRGIDLADTMPAAEWKKRFPDCGPR
jgi:hypothetical protein